MPEFPKVQIFGKRSQRETIIHRRRLLGIGDYIMSRFGKEKDSFFLALDALEQKAKMDRICGIPDEPMVILSCRRCNKIPEYKMVKGYHIISCSTCGIGSAHIVSKRQAVEQWNDYRGKQGI